MNDTQRRKYLINKIDELRIEQHKNPERFYKIEHKKRKLSDEARRLRYKINYD